MDSSDQNNKIPPPLPDWARHMTRRSAVGFVGAGLATVCLPGCRTTALGDPLTERQAASTDNARPIDRTITGTAQAFSGDSPDRSHEILWNKAGYLQRKGGLPTSIAESVPLVIVGGGISGLTTAYLLRQYKPIVLERAERFGGNSRGESWQGIDYSIGAAYFMKPDAGSDLEKHFKDLHLGDFCREKNDDDPVVIQKQRFDKFWAGDSDPKNRAQFQLLRDYFQDLLHEKNGLIFPEIPTDDAAMRTYINQLDGMSFHEHLEKKVGAPLHPHILTAIEHYCWSSFGASCKDLSAASGLNFYAAEFGGCFVAPGGNAAVAERIYERLEAATTANNLRANCIVVDVRVNKDVAHVTYESATGQLLTIAAKAVVMACPKFIAQILVDDFEKERSDAIAQVRYHSYIVANVLLEQRVKDNFYDLFLLGDGTVDLTNIKSAAKAQGATDIVLATFARQDKSKSVLTLYRGFPYDGARSDLLSKDAFKNFLAEFRAQVTKEILPQLQIPDAAVADIRLARWGHPLPCADVGLIANGTVDVLRKPFKGRMFFVEQDNWALPAFETGTTEALTWAPKIATLLT